MSSGVSGTTSSQPTQYNNQVQTERPRDSEAAGKFKDSLSKTSDSRDSGPTREFGADQIFRESGMRMQGEIRHQPRTEQGRVDADGGRGNQGQSKGDDGGKRDNSSKQGQPTLHATPNRGLLDPRTMPRGQVKPGPNPGAQQPGGMKGQPATTQSRPAPGPQARGMIGQERQLPRAPATSVRGTSPFSSDKMLNGLLGQKGKPTLRQTRSVGSRGMPSHRLQPDAQVRDPRFRGSLSAQTTSSPKSLGRPVRTPPPSAGAPLVGSSDKSERMPEIGVQGRSTHNQPVQGVEPEGLKLDRDVADASRDLREKEVKAIEMAPPKPQVEMQARPIEVKSVQQTSKMSQAEIAEIVRKVESMVSKVRLGSNAAGDKQMSLTISDGRLKGVEVNVTVDKSGKLNAEFKAENVDARNLLTENVKELEKSLQAKGLEVNKLEVGSDAAGRRNFASQQEQQQKHEAAQAHLEQMEANAQPARDPRMAGAKPAVRTKPAGAVPGAVPSGAAVPTGQGPESSNYIA